MPFGSGVSKPIAWNRADTRGATATSITLDLPANAPNDRDITPAVGDLYLVIIMSDCDNPDGSTEFSITETGWTKIGESGTGTSDAAIGACWKIATSTEVANYADVQLNSTDSDELVAYGFLFEAGTFNASTPIDDWATYDNAATTAYLSSSGSDLATTVDGAFILGLLATDGSDKLPYTNTSPSDYEIDQCAVEEGGNDLGAMARFQYQSTYGSLGNWYGDTQNNDGNSAMTIAVKPNTALTINCTTETLSIASTAEADLLSYHQYDNALDVNNDWASETSITDGDEKTYGYNTETVTPLEDLRVRQILDSQPAGVTTVLNAAVRFRYSNTQTAQAIRYWVYNYTDTAYCLLPSNVTGAGPAWTAWTDLLESAEAFWKSWSQLTTIGEVEVVFDTIAPTGSETKRIHQVELRIEWLGGANIVHKEKQVNCTTETLSFTDTDATVETTTGGRTVTCTTEILDAVENTATVNAERAVTATTESALLTDTDATVAKDRTVSCSTEILAWTDTDATVTRPRQVTTATETLALTDTDATVNRSRAITTGTEAALLTDTDAGVNTARGVTTATEVILLTEEPATVDKGIDREVTCTTEVLTSTDTDATVNRKRVVSCTTETLSLTDTDASVNSTRTVATATEILSFTDTDTAVNRTRGVDAVSEILTFVDTDTTISRSRGVAAQPEILTLTDTDATVGRARGVTTAPEILNLFDTDAQVFRGLNRTVTCYTEILDAVENPAALNRARGVTTTTEVLALTDTDATVVKGTTVTTATEVLLLTDQDANVNRTWPVDCLTEPIELVESAAAINRARHVTTTTEALSFTDSDAAINKERGVTTTTEVLSITSTPAVIARSRGVVASAEQIALTEIPSSIARNRGVICSAEVMALTDSDSAINRTLIISTAVEVVLLTEQQAQVTRGLDRVVLCSSEILLLTDTDSTVKTDRGVSSQTEIALLTENSAQVVSGRLISCTTEVLALTDSDATVKTDRGVQTGTESALLTDSDATVNATRATLATTEQILLTENPATVEVGANRVVTCSTEVLALSDADATVNATRATVATTEQVLLTESNAVVSYGRSVAGTTETLAFTDNNATVNATRATIATTETLALTIVKPTNVSVVIPTTDFDQTGEWVDLPYAYDGSTATYAYNTSGSSPNLCRFISLGTDTLPSDAIVRGARARFYFSYDDDPSGTIEFTGSMGNSPTATFSTSFDAPVVAGWSDWVNYSTPVGGWGSKDIAEVSASSQIVVALYAVNIGSIDARLYEFQVELTYEVLGVNATRNVDTATETATLTTTPATVETTGGRVVTCATEALQLVGVEAEINAGLCPWDGFIAILDAAFDKLMTFSYSPMPEILWPGIQNKPPHTGMWLEPRIIPKKPGNIVWDNCGSQDTQGTLQIRVYFRPGQGQIEPSELADALIDFFPKGTVLGPVRVRKRPWQNPMITEDSSKLFITVNVPYKGLT
jgi:hypothetical protein